MFCHICTSWAEELQEEVRTEYCAPIRSNEFDGIPIAILLLYPIFGNLLLIKKIVLPRMEVPLYKITNNSKDNCLIN